MFANDGRSRKVVLVAHCVLNQNAVSDGTAAFPGTDEAVLARLLAARVGILQLPCPELDCLGLDRGDPEGTLRPVVEENTRIRAALGQVAPSRILAALVERVVFEVQEYRKHGFEILGLVGINRSPSCGVNTTSRLDQEEPGRGLFMEALREALDAKGLHVPMIGIKASQPEQALARLEDLLGGGKR